VTLPSKGEINRSGDLLRDHLDAYETDPDGEYDWDHVNHALDVLGEFRSSFSYPLTKVTVSLRYMVRAESEAVVVAQRLKRMNRILAKLQRMPDTNVARMEDIGGCRAVLASPAEVTGVLKRIHRRWDVVRERNYVTNVKPSGYRAVHVIVARDDRRIEAQLRTRGQQQWADAVETFANTFSLPLKDERGPDEVLNFFRVAGEGIYSEEYGVPVGDDFQARYREARDGLEDWARTWTQERR
jgi:putative GTP pyrophosphokinase